jgi:hypothetical protein
MKWELFICATQDSYEVCLENLNLSLCDIMPVVMWRYETVIHVVELDSFLEHLGVHSLSRLCIFGVTPALQRCSTSTRHAWIISPAKQFFMASTRIALLLILISTIMY